ncbi:MAG: hypothetical protein PHY28_09840, partial [Dehalococcoidales bacterium]|nr:hypothetical protein [Dehalococcoidales bacterium]
MKKLLYLFMAISLVLIMTPAVIATSAAPAQLSYNFAFIPNSNEASVSKVDLAADPPVEVARYSTIPVRPDPTYTYYNFRATRLAMDSGGNAWALNTMTGIGAEGTQGSVARINFGP